MDVTPHHCQGADLELCRTADVCGTRIAHGIAMSDEIRAACDKALADWQKITDEKNRGERALEDQKILGRMKKP